MLHGLWSKLRVIIFGAAFAAGVYGTTETIREYQKEEVLILRGLTHYDPSGWPMIELKKALEANGYKVRVGNHTEGDDLTSIPSVVIGHSMGANAILKAADRLGKKPRIIVTLDPGKKPLFSKCPKPVRCVNLYHPRLFIAGQTVDGAENYKIKNVPHGTFPQYPKVINAVVRTINENRPTK